MSGIDASRLAEELNALLKQGRIVTWLDRNSEYADDLDAVQELLDRATLITINANLFETKLRIFAEDTKSRYVLYRAGELPSLEEDLLADVRCGYPTFTADASTLLVRELGVDPALAVVIDEYAPFFKSSARSLSSPRPPPWMAMIPSKPLNGVLTRTSGKALTPSGDTKVNTPSTPS